MTRLLIVAHAPLASALVAVARHAFPDCADQVQALDVTPTDQPQDLERGLRAMTAGQDTLVMCDVFGATPCNQALQSADGESVRVVCGVNVPMVWRALCYAHEPLDALVSRAVVGGSQGVMTLSATRPQNQNPPGQVTRDDQDGIADQ